MNNQEIHGQAIRMQPEFKKENRQFDENANILIKNLDKDITQEIIFNEFK